MKMDHYPNPLVEALVYPNNGFFYWIDLTFLTVRFIALVDADMINGDPKMLVAWDKWLEENPPNKNWKYVQRYTSSLCYIHS